MSGDNRFHLHADSEANGAALGPATAQAVETFQISGRPMPPRFLAGLVLLKGCAAEANERLGRLDQTRARAIMAVADELLAADSWGEFPVDVYQTGSGTSTNMNCNEVIAFRATRQLGGEAAVHPNDHVNLGQSSNDVIPTVMHLVSAQAIKELLVPALLELKSELAVKRDEFWEIPKLARTHLQDATPIRLGQEMLGYLGQTELCIALAERAIDDLARVPLGGTAVGTGINTDARFSALVCELLSVRLGLAFEESENHFSAQSTLDRVLAVHGALKTIALSMHKIGCDLRLLGTGPRAGFGELVIPDVGVRSSIMPEKSPPAVIESLTMVVARVVGNDAAMAFAQTGSMLELNVMMPVAIVALLESIELLGAAIANFAQRCVRGLRATEVGPRNARNGVMLATALVPLVGYDAVARMIKEALETDEQIFDVAVRHGLASEPLSVLLDPLSLTEPSESPGGRPAPTYRPLAKGANGDAKRDLAPQLRGAADDHVDRTTETEGGNTWQ